MIIAKIKKSSQKISQKTCDNCFKPVYLKFNFSFLTHTDEGYFDDKAKVALLKRLLELSDQPFTTVNNYDKVRGLEYIDRSKLGIRKDLPSKFDDQNSHRKFNNKFAIFRLYKNNNPTKARIIGHLINKVFYIFYIDMKGDLYNH